LVDDVNDDSVLDIAAFNVRIFGTNKANDKTAMNTLVQVHFHYTEYFNGINFHGFCGSKSSGKMSLFTIFKRLIQNEFCKFNPLIVDTVIACIGYSIS